VDSTAWKLLKDAVDLGHDIRIDLEDTLRLPDREIAHCNAELVSEARKPLETFATRKGI